MNIKNQFLASVVARKESTTKRVEVPGLPASKAKKSHVPAGSKGRKRVLIIGAGEAAQRLAKGIEDHNTDHFEVVGFIDDDIDLIRKHEESILGGFSDVTRIVDEYDIDEVIVVYYPSWLEKFARANAVRNGRVNIRLIPSFYESTICRLSFEKLHDSPVISFGVKHHSMPKRVTKRIFDLIVSVSVLLLAAPFILAAAIATKLSSPGPILYTQERVGRNGRLFKVMKFRSMVHDAEKVTGPTLASLSDPRITRVGAILRKTRLDELPQLLNVLKGEMSFVGPRPERPVFVEMYNKTIPGYAERHRVKPGITGLAQVQGHYLTDAHTKLRHDLLYANHMSLLLDLHIICQTLKVVLLERNG